METAVSILVTEHPELEREHLLPTYVSVSFEPDFDHDAELRVIILDISAFPEGAMLVGHIPTYMVDIPPKGSPVVPEVTVFTGLYDESDELSPIRARATKARK